MREIPSGRLQGVAEIAVWRSFGRLSMTIKKVWIEEGCISCSVCMDIAPDVFDVPEGDDCHIRTQAKGFFSSKAEDIILAAEDCPVEVIHFESVEGGADHSTNSSHPQNGLS